MTATTRIGRPPKCGGCGECDRCKRAAYMREWWASITPEHRARLVAGRDPEFVREQDRRKMARRRTEGTPEQRQRIAARNAVRLAVARGELERPDICSSEDCENPMPHAHHPDHTQPLDVVWLCRDCHDALHRPF